MLKQEQARLDPCYRYMCFVVVYLPSLVGGSQSDARSSGGGEHSCATSSESPFELFRLQNSRKTWRRSLLRTLRLPDRLLTWSLDSST